MTPTKNIFLVYDNNMKPFISKGDLVVYAPMILNQRLYNSVYVVEYRGEKQVARVQFLVSGGMRLLFDSRDKTTIEFKYHERGRVIFIGHVIARYFKNGSYKIDYPFSFNQQSNINRFF